MSRKAGGRRGVLDDFSFVSVVASALTAATSFLLASRIGLAGSLIGAVVAAVISAVATQVYKGVLTASADALREAAQAAVGEDEVPEPAHMLGAMGVPGEGHPSLARRLVLFAVAVALAAVLGVAVVIGLATQGQGIGPTTFVPEESPEAVSEQAAEDDGAASADTEAEAAAEPDDVAAGELAEDGAAQDGAAGEPEEPAQDGGQAALGQAEGDEAAPES